MKPSRNAVTVSVSLILFTFTGGDVASQDAPDISQYKSDLQVFLLQSYEVVLDNTAAAMTAPDPVRSALPSIRWQFEHSHMSRWTLGYNESQWDDFLREMETIPISPNGGLIQQPIQPSKATATWGDGSHGGAEEWKARVGKWKQRQKEAGLMTCDAAIGVLYKHVCGDTNKCDIENEYVSECVKKHTKKNDAKICVAVVEDYHQACFSPDGKIEFEQKTLSAGGTSKRPLCNVVSFQHKDTLAIATARHCVITGEYTSPITSKFHQDYSRPELRTETEFQKQNDGPFAAVGDFAFIYSDKAYELLRGNALPSAKSKEYAPTIFAANNVFLLHRNEVLKINKLDFPEAPLFVIDYSPLCTIVDVDTNDGEILHTCQSSRGSSGGALVQRLDHQNGEHDDYQYGVVGVNTSRSSEDNRTTNMAQFATPGAFE